jgi:hypothetical protein
MNSKLGKVNLRVTKNMGRVGGFYFIFLFPQRKPIDDNFVFYQQKGCSALELPPYRNITKHAQMMSELYLPIHVHGVWCGVRGKRLKHKQKFNIAFGY